MHLFNFNSLSEQNSYYISVLLSPDINYQEHTLEVENDVNDIINENHKSSCSNFEINNNIRTDQADNSELSVLDFNIESFPYEGCIQNNQYRHIEYYYIRTNFICR